ncbi:hypothetical protein ACP70R_032943 [Stipagrostis hirtigluma subsp. patula]
MLTVMASYTTTVGRSPVMTISSVMPARGSWRPPVAFRPSHGVKCRRPLTVTCAIPEKERPPAFSIPPTALLCPVPPPDGKERWDIKEEADRVTLWLQVPGLSEDDIEVKVSDDELEIKRKGGGASGSAPGGSDAHGVGSFHIRLIMNKEYDSGAVEAELKAGMLEVTVGKRPDRDRGARTVALGKQQAGQRRGAGGASSPGEEKVQGGGRGAGGSGTKVPSS